MSSEIEEVTKVIRTTLTEEVMEKLLIEHTNNMRNVLLELKHDKTPGILSIVTPLSMLGQEETVEIKIAFEQKSTRFEQMERLGIKANEDNITILALLLSTTAWMHNLPLPKGISSPLDSPDSNEVLISSYMTVDSRCALISTKIHRRPFRVDVPKHEHIQHNVQAQLLKAFYEGYVSHNH